MTILEDINQQIIEKYKNGDEKTRVFLQTLKAAIIKKEKDQAKELSQDDILGVFKIELKQRQEAFAQYLEAGRNDLAEKIQFEIEYLENLLPKQLSEEEIEKEVVGIVQSSEDKTFPNIMKLAMQSLKGRADGSLVASVVKKHVG